MTKPTGRPRGRPSNEDREAWAELENVDRLAVAIVSLPPARRRVLDVVARSVSIRTKSVATVTGRDMGNITADLESLRSLKLIVRDAGKSYSPASDDVPWLLRRVPSLGKPRRSIDPTAGCAVLSAARWMVLSESYPGCTIVARDAGVSREVAWRWSRRLKSARLWPELPAGAHWTDNRVAQMRAEIVARAKRSTPPPEPKCRKQFIPRVYSISSVS